MPVKLEYIETSIADRIDALRQTIPRDEGLTLQEVATHPTVRASLSHVSRCCTLNHWTVKNINADTGAIVNVLVHPETLKVYESKRANVEKARRK